MDAELYDRCLRHAARVLPADPAIEPRDVLHSAWIKCAALLPTLPGDLDRLRLLMWCVNQVAADHRRRVARRPTLPLGEWLPSGQDVEAEALARLELAALLATGAGAAYAVLIAAGWSRREVGAAYGLAAATINGARWRWRTAQGARA